MAKRDIKLVELFLEHLNSRCGTDYTVTAIPEEAERTKKAVEAIAMDSKGDSIALEHTLIQPFVGDKADTQPLLKVFAPLETDPDCNRWNVSMILRHLLVEFSVVPSHFGNRI